jgi:hypothetical protein
MMNPFLNFLCRIVTRKLKKFVENYLPKVRRHTPLFWLAQSARFPPLYILKNQQPPRPHSVYIHGENFVFVAHSSGMIVPVHPHSSSLVFSFFNDVLLLQTIDVVVVHIYTVATLFTKDTKRRF